MKISYRHILSIYAGIRKTWRENRFEAIYSNSVIEHVGTFEDQMDFAREVRRVGKKLWIIPKSYVAYRL